MTNKDARMWLKEYRKNTDFPMPQYEEALDMAIQALEYDDAKYHEEHGEVVVDKAVWEDAKRALEQEPKKCKDCKWWRDSDGAYRRGVKAESRCPINTVSVANGWGYCYMFEPQESEE